MKYIQGMAHVVRIYTSIFNLGSTKKDEEIGATKMVFGLKGYVYTLPAKNLTAHLVHKELLFNILAPFTWD